MGRRITYDTAVRDRALLLLATGIGYQATQDALAVEGVEPLPSIGWLHGLHASAAPETRARAAKVKGKGEPTGDVVRDEVMPVLLAITKQLRELAKDEGDDPRQVTGIVRSLNATIALIAKLSPPPAASADDAPDIRQGAQDALAALRNLASRVVAERARLPACPACGQPVGPLPGGDKSPLRLICEDLFCRGPA